MDIKIIAGANFGDEGKGLLTDYFAFQSKENCLVIKCNGGSQAGHTVVTPDFIKHVFHHFGSGTFAQAQTYLSKDFIVNPILFRKEREELKQKGMSPICFVNQDCLLTTPYDMLMNQIAEKSRKEQKHGSCGAGIWETIVRNQYTVKDFYRSRQKRKQMLDEIRKNYIPKRLKQLGIQKEESELFELFENEIIVENFLDDLEYFYNYISIADDSIVLGYKTILFECGQGLLLDKNNLSYMPHLTPSNTGIKNPIKLLSNFEKDNKINFEICYVTRTYLTRHGAGRLDTECTKQQIGNDIEDFTNVPNPFQDTLRYGFFDIHLLIDSIKNDLKNFTFSCPYQLNLAITHLNETNNAFRCTKERIPINQNLKELFQEHGLHLDKIYISDSLTRDSVAEI